jgi:RNA polymerase sigma-70 factor (ECF subfamily)
MNADSDKELVERLKGGDHKAFELLVRLHHRSVYTLAFRFMGDHGGADDVVQESFLKAYHSIASFRQEASFKSWLLRITANTAKNALRSRNRVQAVDIEDVQLGYTHKDFGRLENLQTGDLLKRGVEALPPKQRQALELRIFEDMSFKDIAEIMDCPFDTAKANFRHAVMNLKKILGAANGGKALDELKAAFESIAEDELYES